jgi:putative nucleotidyltransferase with HDIG domain
VDVAVAGDAAAAAARLARAHGDATRFRLSSDFGSWRVQGGRLPFSVDLTPVQGRSLAEDLARRDLTVNAMAAPVPAGPLVDPHGGRDDLAAGRLRLVRDDALAADPVRLLRLPRLAIQLGFAIAPETRARATADAGGLWSGPAERLREELGRILRLTQAWRAIVLMDEIGVLGALVPELEQSRGVDQSAYHDRDVLGHTLEVVRIANELVLDPSPVFRADAPALRDELSEPLADDLTRGQALLLAALLHDMAKPATRGETPEGRVTFMGHDRMGAEMADDLCRRLRTSSRLREFTHDLVLFHLPLGFAVHRAPLSLRQIHRYLRHTAPYAGEVIVLSAADRLATAGPRTTRTQIDRHLALAREIMGVHLELRARGPVRPPVGGDEIAAALGREPGPWLGEVMRELEEEVVVGAVRDREGAVRFARRYVAGEVPERPVPGVWRRSSG